MEKWSDYKILWIDDWYDWELAGVCVRDGKRFYFACREERLVPNPDPDPGDEDDKEMLARIFEIFDPPAEAWVAIDECHQDFCRWVGTHFCVDSTQGRRYRSGTVAPADTHHLYYDKWKGKKPPRTKPEWKVAEADSALGGR